MKIKWNRWSRKVHYWGSLIIALPILIVIVTGLILQVKKEVVWVQPATMKGQADIPTVAFEDILAVAQSVPIAEINGWEDIDRLDVRPSKGVVKIRSNNKWEIQSDLKTSEVLQVAFRRSDTIEAIHDGSFFHENAKLWLFLPASIILFILWITGIYMFILPYRVKLNRRLKKKKFVPRTSAGAAD